MLLIIIGLPPTVPHSVPYLLLFYSLHAQKWGLFWGIVGMLLRDSRIEKSGFCLYPNLIAINLVVWTKDEDLVR